MRILNQSLCRPVLGLFMTDYEKMRRASTSMRFVVEGGVSCLDSVFGDGFTRDNPDHLLAYLQIYGKLFPTDADLKPGRVTAGSLDACGVCL